MSASWSWNPPLVLVGIKRNAKENHTLKRAGALKKRTHSLVSLGVSSYVSF